ncbi:MAG: right-handed parallel beta-helix repeat-containing protein [Candidatus Binatia bacterium]
MRSVLLPRRRLAAIVLQALIAVGGISTRAEPVCPDTATLSVFLDNRTGAGIVEVALEGEVAADAIGCQGDGATSYRETLTCTGSGVVRCGTMGGLQPGAWVHRIRVTVPGSSPQEQAQRGVLVAGSPVEVSNALVWTAYPRTFVVGGTTAADLQSALDQAAAYTRDNPGPALVTFDPSAFPGASNPQRVYLMQRPCALDDSRNQCRPDGVADGTTAGLCFTGSRIVVDALDHAAAPGGVILSVDTCGRRLLRLYGSDNVLQGLTLEGSRKPDPVPPCQVDTLGITGPKARRNRIAQAVIFGPTCGDAVGTDDDAGQPDDVGSADNVIESSRITGAADKGVKVDFGAHTTIAQSCLHDNRNGGVQSTLGGHVVARENVVQHNLPGQAQNGLSVAGTVERSTLVTDGNVVRFSGGRGLSVADNAVGDFHEDYVADNQFAGSRVETTVDGSADVVPSASFRGVALVCNRYPGLTGTCSPAPADEEKPCGTVDDCCLRADGTVDPDCVAATQCLAGSFPRGFGAVTAQAAGHQAPDVTYGTAAAPGHNAFSGNRNTAAGANLFTADAATVPAVGNQWEHCGTGAACDVAAVLAHDVAPLLAPIDLGSPVGPRAETLVLERVSPGRPRVSDVVRVFGEGFNAIEGNALPAGDASACATLPACTPEGVCPTGPCVDGACPCAIDDPAVRQRNQATGGNRIRIWTTDGALLATLYPDAVTPTMLAFRMPFDCFAPLTLEVTKRDASGRHVAAQTTLCDPRGCVDRPADTPCDDGNACTVDDHCDAAGRCVGGAPLPCVGECLTCDALMGCVPRPSVAACDDGDACTVGDHCRGDGDVCVPGGAASCLGDCLTGACDRRQGCEPMPVGTTCRPAAGPCDVAETCDGRSAECPGDAFASPATVCRPAVDACDVADTCSGTVPTCAAVDRVQTGLDAVTCVFDRGLPVASCSGDLVPRTIALRFRKAGDRAARARGATGRRRVRLLQEATSLLRRTLRAVERAGRRTSGPLSDECAAALHDVLADALRRAAAQLAT